MPATFNARAESFADKPMFRDSLQGAALHCAGERLFRMDRREGCEAAADGSPLLAFAGLWDRWKDPARGEWILSCTIIVSGASA